VRQIVEIDWSQFVPEHEWVLYRAVIEGARAQGIRFALGGGLAFSTYSGRLRNTKDMDLWILPSDREAMIQVITAAGFADYYEQEAYDRQWIYRGFREGVIVDTMWQFANYRAPVDETWFTRGREVRVHGERFRLLPPEELLWSKLYIIHRDRCDWPDLLNILLALGPMINWEHLLRRVGEDAPLLGGLLSLFSWLCPAQALQLPTWVWPRLGLLEPKLGPDCEQDRRRVLLLDTRDWFGPNSMEGSQVQ
jgi:hypothetical protein